MTKLNMFFEGFKEGARLFGENIVLIINSILLFLVYIFGVGFTSIIAKLVGKQFLNLKISKKGSYWSDLNLKKKKIKNYYKQF
ncbi:hypothetical protein ISS07_06900 [Candidatus Woesearchaeota archaeon]|nr:hypothetical protein [Candidatus Woesearchaeota archaeon]